MRGFQFQAYPNEDIGPALQMPTYPLGASPALAELVTQYERASLNGTGDEVSALLAKIVLYPARSPSDEAMRCIITLHGQHSGVDHDANRLVLIDNFVSTGARDMAEQMIGHLLDIAYRDVNEEWKRLFSEFEDALAIENEYDRTIWTPALDSDQPMDAAIEAEMERLQDVRHKIETELLEHPSVDLYQMAIKHLICRDGGREVDVYTELVLEEARRLTGFSLR